MLILAHLEHPSQQVLEAYYISVKEELERQLKYNWVNGIGKDVSDIIRGKIQMLEEILDTKNVFKKYDDLKKEVEDQEKGAK